MAAQFDPHPGIAAAKRDARKKARAKRAVLHAGANATGVGSAYHRAADLFFSHFPVVEGSVVAVYLSQGHEFDTRPLTRRVSRWGGVTCLPVAVAKDQPLQFRQWSVGEPLHEGMFHIPVPGDDAPVVIPDIVIVPLTAFDMHGMRLGQGGGFYDRTITQLRHDNPQTWVVGLAFEGQCVEAVPHDALDARLDAVVTEEKCHMFAVNEGQNE